MATLTAHLAALRRRGIRGLAFANPLYHYDLGELMNIAAKR